MDPGLVLALDLGTSGCKGALYGSSGQCLGFARRPYPVERRASHFAEQNPRDYVDAARAVCRDLARPRIAAVAFSTQTPTLVFCDAAGAPTAPAILWLDARAEDEARWLLENTSEAQRRAYFGLDPPIGAASTPAKLLWMARRQPEAWRATRYVLQPKDFAAAALTGCFVTDAWCAKGIAHFATGVVHPEYAALLDKPEPFSPPALRPDAVAGRVTAEAARDWGLAAGTPVIAGWSDALAGVLATGAWHRERRGFVLAGTSEVVGLSRRAGPRTRGLFVVPAVTLPLHGLELHYGPTQAGGSTLEWLAKLFEKTPAQMLGLLAERPGLSPILCRPYLEGERAPYWDRALPAMFEGLRFEHGAADLVHAALQGVALQERLVLECAEAGEPAAEVLLAGGAARDHGWNQLRANVLQRPALVLRDLEASLRGAALLGWSALGAIDLSEPPESWFAAEALAPDPKCAEAAAALMTRFRIS